LNQILTRYAAGTGKTFLTSQVVDHFSQGLKRSPHEALAFFYCNRAERFRHDSASILRSLVRQLSYRAISKHEPSIRTEIVALYKEARLKAKKSMQEQLCQQLLLNSVNTYAATTIILEAFDECDKKSRKALVKIFKKLIAESERPVRIFVSSRPADVQNLEWERIFVEEQDNKDDITKYIVARIWYEDTPKQVKSKRDAILKSLLDKSGSM